MNHAATVPVMAAGTFVLILLSCSNVWALFIALVYGASALEHCST